MAGETIMKASDIGQGMLPWDQHKEWSYRVIGEFFAQGDEEKALGLPVSPLCERKGYNICGNQAFFIDMLCKDLFIALGKMAIPKSSGKASLDELLVLADQNKEKWKDEAQNFDPMAIDHDSLAGHENEFGQTASEVIYPYPFEKDEVPTEPISTEQNLAEVARLRDLASEAGGNVVSPAAT